MTKKTLRRQFIISVLSILLIIVFITGSVQGYILMSKINEDIEQQGSMISNSIEQGIVETDLAARNIEHQIDLKLASYIQRVGDHLSSKESEDITNDELIALRDEFNVAGISIFEPKEGEVIGMKSTDPKEIGFNWKHVSQWANDSFIALIDGEKADVEGRVSYYSNDQNLIILFTSQSGAHDEEQKFYKYAYYHEPNTSYMIAMFIEASEIYQFVQKVGPDSWIQKVLKESLFANEIAVLDPKVFADPELEKTMYPPMKKVVNGNYSLHSKKDEAILKQMAVELKKNSYVERIHGTKYYKMFVPLEDGRVIYIALDHDKLSAPLYKFALILIVSGIISLVALFFFTASFFNRIYLNIQKIMSQIKLLEAGDFTVKSVVTGGGELANLSDSTNKMVNTLNQVLTETHEQATKVKRLAVLLESEANDSVDKVFTMSMETTSNSRQAVEEFNYFFDELEEALKAQPTNEKLNGILDSIENMREIAAARSNSTTEITITLSDLLKSLHGQSTEMTEISQILLQKMEKFKLDKEE